MSQFLFTYNAEYNEFNSQQIRKEIITFLHRNGAKNIKQCLATTFVFKSIGKTTDEWYRLILSDLDGNGNILEGRYYLLNRIFYSLYKGFEIKGKCNQELQIFVEEVLKEL